MWSSSIQALLAAVFVFAMLSPGRAQNTNAREQLAARVDVGPTGIDIKRPVFAGACKACP